MFLVMELKKSAVELDEVISIRPICSVVILWTKNFMAQLEMVLVLSLSNRTDTSSCEFMNIE